MYPSSEWIGVVQATQPNYIRGQVDLTIRKRLLLAMLRQKGRITLNESGHVMDWKVKYSLPPTETHTDGAVVDYSNHNSKRNLAIDWRGYTARDSITLKQQEMNKGQNQLVNEYQEKQNNLSQSIRENFCAELFKDGSAPGRSESIHGLETFLGHTACSTADRVALPNASYGLTLAKTNLADMGGHWSNNLGADRNNSSLATDWPDGQGSTEYDHLSPKLINFNSLNWGTSDTSFESNSWRVTSAAIDWLSHTGGTEAKPDLILYPNDMYRAYKNHQEAKTRIHIPHQASQDLGFGDVLNHEGVGIQKDFDCPAGVGYALNCDQMKIRCLTSDMFFVKGPAMDPHTVFSTLFLTGFLGNVEYSPKHFAKIADFVAA